MSDPLSDRLRVEAGRIVPTADPDLPGRVLAAVRQASARPYPEARPSLLLPVGLAAAALLALVIGLTLRLTSDQPVMAPPPIASLVAAGAVAGLDADHAAPLSAELARLGEDIAGTGRFLSGVMPSLDLASR
jgi:hypothetical protein